MEKKHKAKREAIKKLREMMGEMGGKGLKDGMSAQVIAKDKKGLKEGLEKAAKIVGKQKFNDGGLVDDEDDRYEGHDDADKREVDHDAEPSREDKEAMSKDELLEYLMKKRKKR